MVRGGYMGDGEMPGEMVYNGAPRTVVGYPAGGVNNGVVRGMGGAPDVCPTCNRPYAATASYGATYPASYNGTASSRNYPAGSYRNGAYSSPSYSNGSYPPANYQNGNHQPTSYQPTGYQPTGYQPTGYQPTSYQPTSYQPTNYQTGSYQTGSYQNGSYQNGYSTRNYATGSYGTGNYQPRTSPQIDLSQLPPGRFAPKVLSVTDEVVTPASSTADDAQASRPHRAVSE
jgi:hypothetical protein